MGRIVHASKWQQEDLNSICPTLLHPSLSISPSPPPLQLVAAPYRSQLAVSSRQTHRRTPLTRRNSGVSGASQRHTEKRSSSTSPSWISSIHQSVRQTTWKYAMATGSSLPSLVSSTVSTCLAGGYWER